MSANKFTKVVRWLEASFELVREWFGKMAGWISIPFMLLALFNVFSQRLVFALVAYVSLWGLVISRNKKIEKLESRTKKSDIAVYDDFDELIKEGEEMLERFKKNAPPLPTESEFEQWNKRLITLAESCATIPERNRLRGGSALEVSGEEIMHVYVHVAQEHYATVAKLVSKLKVAREIMERLRRGNQMKRS